jgi:hypothetical protein
MIIVIIEQINVDIFCRLSRADIGIIGVLLLALLGTTIMIDLRGGGIVFSDSDFDQFQIVIIAVGPALTSF